MLPQPDRFRGELVGEEHKLQADAGTASDVRECVSKYKVRQSQVQSRKGTYSLESGMPYPARASFGQKRSNMAFHVDGLMGAANPYSVLEYNKADVNEEGL